MQANVAKLLCCGRFAKSNILKMIAKQDAVITGLNGVREIHFKRPLEDNNRFSVLAFARTNALLDASVFAKEHQKFRFWFSTGATKEQVQVTSDETGLATDELTKEEEVAESSAEDSDEDSDSEDSEAMDMMSDDHDTNFEEEDEEYKDMKGSADVKPAAPVKEPEAQPSVV